MSFDLPEEINTNNPKELIAFCVAHGIKEGILPDNFKMSDDGYRILEGAVVSIWNKVDTDILTQIMISFIAGYATGQGTVEYKK